jgi:UPF0755 protein
LRLGCLLFLGAVGVCLWVLHDISFPADATGRRPAQIIKVEAGSTAAEVGRVLEEKDLIPSAFAFRVIARFSGQGAAIRAGYYEIKPSEAPLKILEKLVRGQTLVHRVTVPEGLTLREVALLLEQQKIVKAADFLAVASRQGRRFGADLPDNLEGYLFPDTYELPWVVTAEEVVAAMVGQFREKALPLWTDQAPLSLRDTVILASLVEREARLPAERPVIAGVYLNRLKRGMPLGCDATIQYALGKRTAPTWQELEIDSPYNTYLRPGLPPGPICNPGRACFEAAVKPKKTGYLYYVRNDVKGDGSHIFTSSLEEHNDAIRRYQR